MKKFIILLAVVSIVLSSKAQHVTIVNETFSGVPNGWTVTSPSSATWSRDTNYYLSSPSSYKGNVPSSANAGTTVVLTSPVFDLSQYPYVFLRFSHICKVSNADICQVSIKEDFTGSQWHVIPPSCYLGAARNYSKDRKFSDMSYTDWRSDSLLIQPTNAWWKTESFDISSEASYAPVQFRFTITKGNTIGTEYAIGWFIDNFELIASMSQISPPVVEFLSPLVVDTVYHTGPYTINAKVATRTYSPINPPKLEVRYIYGQNTTYDTLLMNNVAGDSIWNVVIPQVLYGTSVKYSINASDTGGNVSFSTAEFYAKRLGIDDSNSVAMTSIDYPKDLVVGGQPTPVVVTFTNKGIKDMDSCILNWSVNGTLQPSHTWRGRIADGHSAQDTIGYYSPRQNTYDTIVVWVGMPNGIIDTIIHDDTAHVYTYGCVTILSGEYIVGTDSGSHFMSINNVISALGGCGSSGNVILKLQKGILNENVNLLNLRSLLGIDDTLIITSQTGNAQDVIIQPTDGSAFTIGKSDNIVIKNLTIDVSSATTLISNGIYFIDSCTNIWIDSCIIKAKNVTDTGYDCIRQIVLPVNTGGVLKNIYITNNTILDGYHGIYLSGRASNAKNTNINICNNTIRPFGIGVKLWGSDFSKINNNYITRNSTVSRWCHGIYFQYAYGKEVINNRIHLSGVGGAPSPSWSCGGIIGWSGNGPRGFSATDRLLIANNEVIIVASNVYARGIYCSSGPVCTDFVHNSVLITGTVGTGTNAPMCFDIVNGVGTAVANQATIYNNNFINLSGTSTGTKNYAIRLPASNTGFIRDYNNYYSVGRYAVATRSVDYSTIQSWISAFYLDSNSVSVLPDSISANSTDLIIEGSQILCPALNQISYDIDDNQRIVTTNMGCYHTNIPDTYDAGIAELSFSRAFADSAYPTVLVSVLNMGAQTLDSVNINWSVNGVMQSTYKWYGSLNRGEQSQKVNIGNFMVRKGINTIVVYTSSPNGQPLDSDHSNDTAYYQEFACGLPLVGSYTVGGVYSDFIDEKEMMQAIRDCGIGGSVVFEFESGVYGDLSFSNYPLPLNSMDSIIITSSARHADSVVFMSSDAAALSIGNVVNFIFEKVTFDATTNGYCAVKFMNPMNDIKFYECNIFANPTATTTDYAGIYYAGLSGNINDISFVKNKITGGYYSIYFKNTGANRFILDSNELIDAAGAGVFCEDAAHFSSISYNKIISKPNTTFDYYGIHLKSRGNVDTVVCNKIYITTTRTAYGFNMYYQLNYSLGVPVFVANNELILQGTTCYGIHGNTTGSSGAVFAQASYFNNSVYVKGSSVYGVYFNEYAGTNDNRIYKATLKYNNIYATSTSGGNAYAYYIIVRTSPGQGAYSSYNFYDFDYNNYYSTATNLAYIDNQNCASIADIWATNLGMDSNSINIDPMFSTNPIHLSPSAMLPCPLVPYIIYDIENELRTASNNSMGCYAKFFDLDVGLDTLFMPTPVSFIGNQTDVIVRLVNYGMDTLRDAKIQWSLNGVLQTPFNISNLSLAQYEDTVLNVGSFTPLQSGNIHVKVWTNCDGDVNTLNDTISITTYACDSMLNGTYTIGSNNRDFTNINDALTALSNCGISGAVTFLIDAGIYDSVEINRIYLGANDTNTVTFTSATGNANDVKIESSSIAVSLTDAAHLNFTYLTIDASRNTTPSAIKLISSANNIEFSNCIIKAPVLQSELEGRHEGAIFSDHSTNINNLRILHNTIDGGYSNIYLITGQNHAYGQGIVIDHNTLTNAFYAGIYVIYSDIKSISYNQITSKSSNAKNFIGIYASYSNIYINANKIRAATVLQAFKGIDLWSVNTNTTNKGMLCNNEIIATTTSAENHGISLNSYTYVEIINNSIYLNSADAKCLFVNHVTADILLRNNSFISAATAYPIYFTLATYFQNSIMDYNNYYNGGNNIAYAGTEISDMLTWRTLTMNDMHSVSVLPSFVDINTDLSITDTGNNALVCPIFSGVLSDINDSSRISYTYMGAYTAAVFTGNDLELISIVEPINNDDIICLQNFATVKVAVKNIGGSLIDFADNNLKLCVSVSGTIVFQADTLIESGTIDILESDTFEITNILPISQNGTYHITAWIENIIDQVSANDTARTDYMVNLLKLPYSENFDTLPSTFVFTQLSGNLGWSVEQGAGTNPVINPIFGTGRLTFASELGSIGIARLHPINLLKTQSPKLEFWYAHDDNNSTKDDKTFVRVSIDGGVTYENLTEIKRYNQAYTTPTFIRYSFDLSKYTPYSCVIIDFYGQSYGGGKQNIDSVSVTSLQDLQVDISLVDQNDLIACELDNKVLAVNLSNLTSQDFEFEKNPVNLVVEVSGVTNTVYNYSLITGEIQGEMDITLVIDTNFDLSTSGTYNFKAYINQVDNNTSNDTAITARLINVDVDMLSIDSIETKKTGDVVYPTIHLRNNGNIPIKNIPLHLQINKTSTVKETIDTILNPGESIDYTFINPFYVPEVGAAQPFYLLEISSELECDENIVNDIVRGYYSVDIENYIDLAITSVIKPNLNSCDSGLSTVYPILNIENKGIGEITNITLFVVVDSAEITLTSYSESIDFIDNEEILLYTCETGYTVPNFDGNYKVTFWISVEEDIDSTNDTLSVEACAIYNDVSVENIDNTTWTLGQNIPNPSVNQTHIPFNVPVAGEVTFELTTINGQVLYREKVQASTGSNSFDLSTESLSNGIYYYSMEYKGQRIVKKMTIQK